MQIDDLARITQEQFAVVDERFNRLEGGMQKLEQKLDAKLQRVLDVVLELVR